MNEMAPSIGSFSMDQKAARLVTIVLPGLVSAILSSNQTAEYA